MTTRSILHPSSPLVWPEARVLEGLATYASQPPYSTLAQVAKSVFGIVTAPTSRSIRVLESWLSENDDLQVRIIAAIYPTSATRQVDLVALLRLVENKPGRIAARILPLNDLTDRATNILCFVAQDADTVHLTVGPSEDLGLAPPSAGQANLVFRADASLVEALKRYFDRIWTRARDLGEPGATDVPALAVPEGTVEARCMWEAYMRGVVNDDDAPASVRVDSETGEVTLVSPEGESVPSPTDEIGLSKLDGLSDRVARLYEQGALVSIDKLARIPPLDAPVDPGIFGDTAELHQGSVVRKTSLRASIIDERTLKELDRCRKGLRTLLNRFTFALADNVRWMPTKARQLFDEEVARLTAEGQQLVSALLTGGVEAFVATKRDMLVKDLNAMYASLGRTGQVPSSAVDRVVDDLKQRLSKAQTGNFLPTVAYSPIGFGRAEGSGVSPWGQAYSLLASAAEFPRKALTDPFFFRGLKVPEDALIDAMNVADDALLREPRGRGLKERCSAELRLLAQIAETAMEPRRRCELVEQILAGEDTSRIVSCIDTLKAP